MHGRADASLPQRLAAHGFAARGGTRTAQQVSHQGSHAAITERLVMAGMSLAPELQEWTTVRWVNMHSKHIGIRWTIGDVDALGFDALRLSIWGAFRVFGPEASHVVYVNSIDLDDARQRTGDVPAQVLWRRAQGLPTFLAAHLDPTMAEGVAWKLAPLRAFPDRYELSLDNDCILWELPAAMRAWLEESEPRCLIAADVVLAHGAFTDLTGPEPRNTGIRGLPPDYDLGDALRSVLARHDVPLQSELDEQGLQVAALDLERPAHVVPTSDVSICAPFWPKTPVLGRCGAHFVGLNTRHLAWSWYGRPARDCIVENWHRHRMTLEERVLG